MTKQKSNLQKNSKMSWLVKQRALKWNSLRVHEVVDQSLALSKIKLLQIILRNPLLTHGHMRYARMMVITIQELTNRWIGSFTTGIKTSRLKHITMQSRLIPICGLTATKCQSKLLVICSYKGMASNMKCTACQMLMQAAKSLVLINNRPD